jgi:hypothetical protein
MVLDDEYLHPFSRLFEGIADLDAALVDEEFGAAFLLDEAIVELPIELSIGVTDQGTVALATAPPTQHVETTYMPVFHQIRLSVRSDGDR